MRYEWLNEYLLQKRGVTKDYQPVWNWIRYHIGSKMFAALCLDKAEEVYYINLKLEESESALLRGQYADILPGYYSDKRCWVSVKPDGAVPDELLRTMLDKSYGLTLAGMSKKARRQALGLTACGLECADCPLYQGDCPGCNECGGRVFHASPGKPQTPNRLRRLRRRALCAMGAGARPSAERRGVPRVYRRAAEKLERNARNWPMRTRMKQ